jgi:outer membrane protein assembly factor BamD (BamD/ComL family)
VNLPRYILACLAAAAIAGCATAPATPDVTSLSAPKLVQAAQGAADKGNYAFAMTCYQAIQTRFPDDVERGLWASYEIAFLQHKMGKDDEAIRLFDELIAGYASRADGASLPQGPRILAEKIKASLLAKKKTNPPKRPT